MTQIQLTYQELNRALAELMGWLEIKTTESGRLWGRNGARTWYVLDYCSDPAASLEVQSKAIEVDDVGYVKNLCFIKWGEKQKMGGVGLNFLAISRVLTASPRERAEAAYITLQGAKG